MQAGAYGGGAYGGGGWGDTHVSPQFTNPTKVIHLRNLPFEVTVEEIRELCAPWGTVVAVKDKVGNMKNQAFVEFQAIEQAIAIVTHYAQSPEPAKLRGRPTWLSYSGRDKLTNVSPVTDSPTPTLQITLAHLPAELLQTVNLDLLNTIISPYGFVRKLVTYNRPEGGMSAWAQFIDATTANTVKLSLGGQAIPRHLLGEHPTPPIMEMAFSTHLDLGVRTQSYCTRDFTNPALPWGDPEWPMINALLPSGGADGGGNVLTINFDNMTYPVTVDGLHTIFSTYGQVQKIHIYEREGKTVALVQYPDGRIADVAKAALQGHAMYDGGHNVMNLAYSKHRNLTIRPGERSRDFTAGTAKPGAPGAPPMGAAAPRPPAAVQYVMPGAPPPGMPPAGMHSAMPQRPGMPPAGAIPPAAPAAQAAAMPPLGGPPPPAQASTDPNFQVTGEDYVKAHEQVLQQYGGRTRGAAAPYAGAPAAAPPAAPAYPGYGAPAAAAPAPAYYAPPPAAGPPVAYYVQPGAPAYGAAPAAPPPYGGPPAAAAAPYGGYAPPPAGGAAAAYGAPPPGTYPGY
ncbi:hypothetical protein ABPG75_000828 [Micractinium tetrahymenae]